MRMYNANLVASGSIIGGVVGVTDTRVYIRDNENVKFYSLKDGSSGTSPFQGDFAPLSGGAVIIQNGELIYENE